MDIDLLPYFVGGPQYSDGPQQDLSAVTGPLSYLNEYLVREIERNEQLLEDEQDAGRREASAAACRRRTLTTLQNLSTLVSNRDIPGIIRFLEEGCVIMEHVLQIKQQEADARHKGREIFYPDLELYRLLIKTFRGHT